MQNTDGKDLKSIDPKSMSLPLPAFAGGTKAITMTPVVGTPRRKYAERFIPGEEKVEDGEMRVTVLGSGNPWVTRGRAWIEQGKIKSFKLGEHLVRIHEIDLQDFIDRARESSK